MIDKKNQETKIKNEEFRVSFHKISLKYHADVIAGRQMGLSKNKTIMKFVNEFIITPCNHLLATFFEFNFKKSRKVLPS